jgi:hypothetical protein
MSATIAAPRSTSTTVAAKVNAAATTALSWAKLLAAKAFLAARGGWTYAWTFASTIVRKNAFSISMGGALLLASEKGYGMAINAITSIAKLASKAVIGTLHGVNRGIGWIGNRIARVVGKANKDAGNWVQGLTWTITGAIASAADIVKSFTAQQSEWFTVSALSRFTMKFVNYSAMAFFTLIGVNAVSGGVVATAAASVPLIGGTLAGIVGGGIGSMMVLAGFALAGIAYTMMFRAQEVGSETEAAKIAKIDADSMAKFKEAEEIRAADAMAKQISKANRVAKEQAQADEAKASKAAAKSAKAEALENAESLDVEDVEEAVSS